MKAISLIPYNCGAGASTAGCEQGPSDLFEAGLCDGLRTRGLDVKWHENPAESFSRDGLDALYKKLPELGTPERKEIVLSSCSAIRDAVISTIKSHRLPVTIGGDHSMAAGSIAGLAAAKKAHGRIGLIWIDAHPDLNTPDTSPSDALHGMPVSFLLGQGSSRFTGLAGGPPVLKPEHICYVGIRDIDPDEADAIKNLPINAYTMDDVRKYGIEKIFSRIMDALDGNVDCLALSLDVDGFDPDEAPSVGTPVENGLKQAELLPVLADLCKNNKFDLIEIAEYNPTLGGKEKTRALILEALSALLLHKV